MLHLRPTTPAIIAYILSYYTLPSIVNGSRAYPHGCLYRHPSYYTYDERDDITWSLQASSDDDDEEGNTDGDMGTELYTDFRYLPSKSSKLRRPYTRYKLIRRLGAGKFSDVFEAVDIEWDGSSSSNTRIGEENRQENEILNVKRDGKLSSEKTPEEKEDDVIDTQSLVVLKCLKPVSERKIRRELLVLTHCISLPNLARVVGIVLPDSMDSDSSVNKSNSKPKLPEKKPKSTQSSLPKKKQRRHHNYQQKKLQQDNIGSITDVAEIIRQKQKKKASAVASSTIPAKKNSKLPTGTQPHQQQQLPALVLEHAGQNAQWFCHGISAQKGTNTDTSYLTETEMKYYLCHLLVALDGLHSAGIIHRDVKPRNCLINRVDSTNETTIRDKKDGQQQHPHPLPPPPLMLVDLGLADFYLPGKDYNVRVASRHYKSPELLVGYKYYDYAIDLWSVGCMLAGLLFRREPFFRGKDNEDQLGKIVSVLGTRDFLPYCRKCNVRLSSKSRAAIGKYCSASLSSSSSSEERTASLLNNDMSRRKAWLSFLSPNTPVPSQAALDLLDKLLVYDHEQRWTCQEAIRHAFFDDVRDYVMMEVQERIKVENELLSIAKHWR